MGKVTSALSASISLRGDPGMAVSLEGSHLNSGFFGRGVWSNPALRHAAGSGTRSHPLINLCMKVTGDIADGTPSGLCLSQCAAPGAAVRVPLRVASEVPQTAGAV